MGNNNSCMCNTGCFGGLQMTYNRRRCDPATTRRTNTQANDYCEDFPANPPASPTGNLATERLTVGFYYCDGRDTLLGYRNMITDELSFDLNVRNVQTSIPVPGQATPNNFGGSLGVCLPDCIQVRLSSYNSRIRVDPLPTEYTPIQRFNIDTRCAGNSLVSRTNYGAFYYREDFNVQCPVGKKINSHNKKVQFDNLLSTTKVVT